MRDEKANKLIDTINKGIEKNGIDVEAIVPELKKLREFAKKEEDPLVTKVLRLTYEYIEENEGAFDVEAQYEEDEDGNELPLEVEDKENLMYLLDLLKKSDNKYNREEIADYRTELKESLY